MNSNQIKCFLSVGKTASFTRSAKDLYLSQSTISKNVANLEKELKVKLLDRSHQQVKLTPKGRKFYLKLSRINVELQDAIRELQEKEEGKAPLVYLGYMDIPFETEYIPLAVQMIDRRLNISLRTRIIDPNSSLNFSNLLKSKKLDYLIYQKDYFTDSEDFVFEPLIKRGFSVMANNDSPLFVRNALAIRDLQGQNIWFWNTQKRLPTIESLVTQIKASNIDCNLRSISDSIILIDYVRSGKGIGIVPAILYNKMDPALRYVPLETNISIIYGVAYLKTEQEKLYHKGLIKALRQAIDISKEKW